MAMMHMVAMSTVLLSAPLALPEAPVGSACSTAAWLDIDGMRRVTFGTDGTSPAGGAVYGG